MYLAENLTKNEVERNRRYDFDMHIANCNLLIFRKKSCVFYKIKFKFPIMAQDSKMKKKSLRMT